MWQNYCWYIIFKRLYRCEIYIYPLVFTDAVFKILSLIFLSFLLQINKFSTNYFNAYLHRRSFWRSFHSGLGRRCSVPANPSRRAGSSLTSRTGRRRRGLDVVGKWRCLERAWRRRTVWRHKHARRPKAVLAVRNIRCLDDHRELRVAAHRRVRTRDVCVEGGRCQMSLFNWMVWQECEYLRLAWSGCWEAVTDRHGSAFPGRKTGRILRRRRGAPSSSTWRMRSRFLWTWLRGADACARNLALD